MTPNVEIRKLASGVPGLDAILGGGIPEYSFILLAGPPGSGKTTLANQIMFSLAAPERPALYFTVLGEPPLKMLRFQQQFTFFDPEKVTESIRYINLSSQALTGNLDVVLERIAVEVRTYRPALVFVDSFRSVVLSAQEGERPGAASEHNRLQLFMQNLAMLMTSWEATSFLIGEYFTDTDSNPVFTVADGMVWLRQSAQRNSMVRKIEIMKMRGHETLPGLHAFRLGVGGMEVFPHAQEPNVASDDAGEEAEKEDLPRVKLGIPKLDEMLGGGLPQGHSLLVAGPSGSGKSILAASFLAEGARLGETGVIAVFEKHPRRLRRGILASLIRSGEVTLVQSSAPDLSIGEVMHKLLGEIARVKATRLVIDSLSGFELKLAPTFREDFRESLLHMVNALVATGVTVVMTTELEDRYTDLRFSPYGTAFLTDAIIVQRYIEVESRLRRVIAVVKVRDSWHSNQLHEYTIDSDGIQIGEMLPEQIGMLGGRPTRQVESGTGTPSRRKGPPAA